MPTNGEPILADRTDSRRALTEAQEDRLDAALLAEAGERGYHLGIRCARCGQWLNAEKSVLLHLGPRCREKIVAERKSGAA